MQYPSGLLTIDLGAIQANWRHLRAQLAPGAECGAVVKANAYGLGMEPVASALQESGCTSFFVVSVAEGVALRHRLGERATIYLLHGVKAGEEPVVLDRQLIPVLSNIGMVKRWLSFCEGNALPPAQRRSVLKVNTGMNRLGLDPGELRELLQNQHILSALGCELLMSHLACAEDADHPLSRQQLQVFTDSLSLVRQQKPTVRGSLANSAATLQGQRWHFDLVRPGIGLYGSNPTGQAQHKMQPVVTLELPVLQRRRIAPGSAVGYGATYVAENERCLAAVGGGYGDGLFRSLGNRGHVWFKTELPIVGRVSMDSLMVDLSALPDAERPVEGDYVELLGAHVDIDSVGEKAGTVAYEVLTRLSGRYQRRYVLNGHTFTPEGQFS